MNNEPIIKQALGSKWSELDELIRSHYRLKPLTSSQFFVTGVMGEIYHSRLAKLFIPIAWLFGAIVPFNKTNVPTDVIFKTKSNSFNLYWRRIFEIEGRDPFIFKSHMELSKDNTIIEFVRFGLGMELDVSVKDGKLIFRSKKFIWRLFGFNFPLPFRLFFGSAYVEERSVDDNHFSMKLVIRHPLFGELFRYKGVFSQKTKLARTEQ